MPNWPHEKLPEAERLPPAGGHDQLTVARAMWWHERPDGVDMGLSHEGGHVLVQVEERNAHGGVRQYKAFYDAVGKDFVLRAEGRPSVHLSAERGYWGAAGVFYLRIPPKQLERMIVGVPYALAAKESGGGTNWDIADGVTLVRRKR